MRKLAVIALSIVFHTNLPAQKTVFSFQPWGGSYYHRESRQAYAIPDEKTNKIAIILLNKNNVDYVLLDKNFSQKENLFPADGIKSTIFKADIMKYRGSIANNLGFCSFFSMHDKAFDNGAYEVRMEVVDFNRKTITNRMLFQMPLDENIMTSYTKGRTLYIVSARDNTSQLVFHIVDEDGNVVTKTINMNIEGLLRYKVDLSTYILEALSFDGNNEGDFNAASLTKMYVYPDSLVMIVSNPDVAPQIWTIDTRSFSVSPVRKLDVTGFEGFNNRRNVYNDAFCIFRDNLYLLNTGKAKIEIGIYDSKTWKLLRKYDITDTSTVPFAETPVQFDAREYAKRTMKITNISELIRKLSKRTRSISAAVNANGQILLTCGISEEGTAPASVTSGGEIYYVRRVYFKLALDPATLNAVQTTESMSYLDKAKFFMTTVGYSAATTGFKMNDKYFACYYKPSDRMYYVVEIDN